MGELKHRIIWNVLRFPVMLFLKIKFNYSCKPAGVIPGPFLLIANHVTDLDPLMVGCGFCQPMHFVASEHLFRKGFLTKLLVWLVAPIARVKGSTDTVSAMKILRTLRQNSNVGLFAEGDRSWNGTTNPLHPTTARLIKASKATLVTFRLTGGYLTSPRWSPSIRRGKMNGEIVKVYTPAQLAELSDIELTERINGDIAEDAYETQRHQPVAFRGKKLAEFLEMAIYTCPSCRKVATMHSRDNMFYCDCGLSVSLNEYGSFEGDSRPFETITEWDTWQNEFLKDYIRRFVEEPVANAGPILSDPGQCLYQIGSDHSEKLVAEGTMALYRDRFELGGFSVSLDKLYQMGVYNAGNLVFSAEGANYEIKSAIRRSGRKYYTLHQLLTSTAVSGNKHAVNV